MKMYCLLAGLLFFSHAMAATTSARMLKHYELVIKQPENLVVTHSSTHQIGIITSRKGKSLILGVDYQPISIRTVTKLAKEDGVDAKSVKIKRYKTSSLFYYETPDVIKVYSTMGGHLSISKKSTRAFDFNQLRLVQKNKQVVSL